MHLPKSMLNIVLRVLTLGLFAFRWWYWKKQEKQADTIKPKKEIKNQTYKYISRIVFIVMYYGMIAQVLGLRLLPLSHFSLGLGLLGIVFVAAGVAISIIARKQLGTNWTNGYEYQIKKAHSMVTHGIYAVIRHPIYTGLALCFIGGEMVAQSSLWISSVAFFVAAYVQGKREEKLLVAHFGSAYQEYRQRTKMLIPFVL